MEDNLKILGHQTKIEYYSKRTLDDLKILENLIQLDIPHILT